MYDYKCDREHVTTRFKKLEERNAPVRCQTCGHDANRAFVSPPHMGAIPGILNKVNQNWKESGQVLYDPNRPDFQPKYRNPRD